ncbi:helix-turn-helix domain-containing protein [Dawidia soli]|uniref:Helix-turn-helix transcriptional regulator n=1 Tax=Dawidia soli TaxID=2782352 RepID=A0AAP2D448_9BACT|nr:AraC family transcriptional regulator [Dawidia soli]MBT1684976.1 helix-turn-helix transcriptional regulator [Dawidia soli]
MAAESLGSFYRHKVSSPHTVDPGGFGEFNVFNIEERVRTGQSSPAFVRRDFYKIMLFQGDNIFHYADKSIPVSGSTLLYFNPSVPYTYEPLHAGSKGYFCVFRDGFLGENLKTVKAHALFAAGAKPVFPLNKEQTHQIAIIFQKMEAEVQSTFAYKYELIRSYTLELIYLGLKLNPADITSPVNAGTRIMAVFNEILERQFPIEHPAQRFDLRSPRKIADLLSVHVNYLNRVVKQQSGRTTSEYIADRLSAEAQALLRHTDWTVSEIGYALGFETASQFNAFFKKQTSHSPLSFRKV